MIINYFPLTVKTIFSTLIIYFYISNSYAQQTSRLISKTSNDRTVPPPIFYDLGDAPNSYITDRDSGGPIHSRIYGMPEILIGQIVDYEEYVPPNSGADGDDLDNSQDEDGINPSDLESISVTSDNFSIDIDFSNGSSEKAHLYAWIDFDGSGSFDVDEFTFVSDLNPGVGVASLTWSDLIANGVDIIEGVTYARFRITIENLTSADVGGEVQLGEVEDYVFVIGNSTLGIDDEILENGLKIYPNPVSNMLNIDSKLLIKNIAIYSILGQKVKEFNSDFNSISTKNLSKGIYMIKISSENGTTVRKLIKQ